MNNIENLKSRLQFALTLSFFFPVLIDTFFQSASAEEVGIKMISTFGVVVSLLILSYMIVELYTKFDARIIKIVNVLVLLQIFTYVPVMIIFSYGNISLTFIKTVLYSVDLFGLLLIPLAIFILLLISPTLSLFEWTHKK